MTFRNSWGSCNLETRRLFWTTRVCVCVMGGEFFVVKFMWMTQHDSKSIHMAFGCNHLSRLEMKKESKTTLRTGGEKKKSGAAAAAARNLHKPENFYCLIWLLGAEGAFNHFECTRSSRLSQRISRSRGGETKEKADGLRASQPFHTP